MICDLRDSCDFGFLRFLVFLVDVWLCFVVFCGVLLCFVEFCGVLLCPVWLLWPLFIPFLLALILVFFYWSFIVAMVLSIFHN